MLTQPTRIRLDFDDRPLPEVVAAIGERSGVKLALVPENAAVLQGRRITLRDPELVPFWKAIDRLCDAGQLQYNLGVVGLPTGRAPVFPLYATGVRPAGPMSDSGPFRVNLVSLHYQRDVVFVTPAAIRAQPLGLPPAPLPGPAHQDRPGSAINEQFYAQVQVAAEPRLSLSQNGPLRITEAEDDRGQSLLTGSGSSGAVHRYSGGYFGLTTGSTVQMQAPLRHPDAPGKAIRTLRGVLPVLVTTRKPGPLVAPLSGAPGKSFQNDEVVLDVLDIRVHPNPNITQTSIDLSIRSRSGPTVSAPGPQGEIPIHRPDMHQQQLEVVDAQGRPIPWYQSSFDAEGARVTLTLTPNGQGTPAEVRYYGLARAATEVGFEFSDVPMP